MAEDMRTKAYPPLPPKGDGPRIAIVLPTTGDLRLRSLLPDAFQQQLVIHADPTYYPYYARFVVLRKFIVMSSDGDLYTQTVRTTLELNDLPRQQLLSLPSISPWDIVKVLDLVQCYSANVSWELVRVRWQSGMVTWLPIELLQRNFATLLQAFYVNSINSWGFRDRIYAQSLHSFQTEVELWLHHDEFRKFYQFLRQRRAMVAAGGSARDRTSSPQEHQRPEDVKPVLKRPIAQPQPPARPAPAPPARPPVQQPPPPHNQQQQRTTAATNHDRSSQQQQQQQTTTIVPARLERPQASSASAPTRTQSTGAVREKRSQASASAATSSASIAGRSSREPQAEASRDAVTARRAPAQQSIPPAAANKPQTTAATSASSSTARAPESTSSKPSEPSSAASPAPSKRFKRLRKARMVDDSSESEDDELVPETPQASPPTASANASAPHVSDSALIVPVAIVDEEDEAWNEEASKATPTVIGDIRCVCGADSVGAYAGKWLHCWMDDCGIWEHADCVGLIGHDAQTSRYVCSNCDAAACRVRRASAKAQLVAWLFQCCESKNTVQLLTLLRENPSQESTKGWRNPKEQNMTLLMKAARFGLVKSVQHLVHVAKVDVFATDDASLNVLHHAVLGGSRRCVLYLLNQEPKLVAHQDKQGRTPFHCLLASVALNDICLQLLSNDPSLAVTGDLAANAPIHYACRALSAATPEICRILLQDQPQSIQEASSDGLSPLLLLCQADRHKLSATKATAYVKDVVNAMLDIDVLGSFLDARAPNGWMAIHFAAASGNHELVSFLCRHELVDVHAGTTESSETALHIAARAGHALCVRALLRSGLRETAKDADGWIPMLHAPSAACIQEFLPYKLTKQLSRLNRMTGRFQQKDLVRQWQRRVVTDPTCFDMINDWCQSDLDRIERMSGLFLATPFMLRLDNKLDYLYKVAFASYRAPQQEQKQNKASVDAETATTRDALPSTTRRGLKFAFDASSGSYWRQFVSMAKGLDPEDFRAPMQFTTASSREGGDARADTKAVLSRLVGGLSAIEPGFLSHSVSAPEETRARTESTAEALQARLLDFYLLGELVAHLVLYGVSLSGVLDFSPSFLRCALREPETNDAQWLVRAQSFAGGFEHVAPSALSILRPNDFRVLVNGRTHMLNASVVEWGHAMDWSALGESDETRTWWSRLVSELVLEEQQLVLLLLTETFTVANQKLWFTTSGTVRVLQRLVKVLRFSPPSEADDDDAFPDDDDDDAVRSQTDALLPFVDQRARTMSLPVYSDYEAFKRAMLRWMRHVDAAYCQR